MYKVINILYAYIHFTVGKPSEDKRKYEWEGGCQELYFIESILFNILVIAKIISGSMIQWELHVIYNFTLRKLENFTIWYCTCVMHLYKCINIFFILNYRRESNNKEEKEEQ